MAAMLNEDFATGLESINKAIELSPNRLFNYINRSYLTLGFFFSHI